MYGFTTWILTKHLLKKLDGNYIRMKKFLKHHITQHHLYGHLYSILTNHSSRTNKTCWILLERSELVCNVFSWISTYRQASVDRPAKPYVHQLPSRLGLLNTPTAPLQRGKTPRPMSVLIMTLNNLMVSFQLCWGFGEYGGPLQCHCSQVLSGPAW